MEKKENMSEYSREWLAERIKEIKVEQNNALKTAKVAKKDREAKNAKYWAEIVQPIHFARRRAIIEWYLNLCRFDGMNRRYESSAQFITHKVVVRVKDGEGTKEKQGRIRHNCIMSWVKANYGNAMIQQVNAYAQMGAKSEVSRACGVTLDNNLGLPHDKKVQRVCNLYCNNYTQKARNGEQMPFSLTEGKEYISVATDAELDELLTREGVFSLKKCFNYISKCKSGRIDKSAELAQRLAKQVAKAKGKKNRQDAAKAEKSNKKNEKKANAAA